MKEPWDGRNFSESLAIYSLLADGGNEIAKNIALHARNRAIDEWLKDCAIALESDTE